MTILVTGATGLVGPRLLRRFADSGVTCRALVRPHREVPNGVERAEGDLQDIATLERAVSGVSAIVHLAAVFRTQDESAIWKTNLDGTKNLIAAAKKVVPRARFIMASTSNVYAYDLGRPAREDDATTTETAYAASKLAAESELRSSGLSWGVLRFPFIYGDGDGHLESTPALLARMHTHPAQRFSVLHHHDLANAVELALSGAIDGLVVNAAGDAPISAYEMAQVIGGDYEPSSEPLVNPWRGQVDTSLARSLGFRPEVLTVYQASRENRL
jgi:nucleoside-diphosphate-sugar epimerase